MSTQETADAGAVEVAPGAAALPLVTIVGRPNVGKSTLFNRLIGERRAIVGDEPGITRDRIYGAAEWQGRRFAVVDTGGIVPDDDAIIPANIFKQAATAVAEAAALVWVVDVRAGTTPLAWMPTRASSIASASMRSFQSRRSRAMASATCSMRWSSILVQ